MCEVVYRPRAAADLEQIARYTKRMYDDRQARKYLAELREQADLAAELPGRGSPLEELPQIYRRLAAGHHRIIYRYDDEVLTIVRVLHERQDALDLDDLS